MRRNKVLHSELQQHVPSELGRLSDMSTGEQHIIHIEDEEDGTPVECVLNVEAMVLIRLKKANRSYKIGELSIPLPRSLL
jgi:hypothetical protein